MATLGEHTRADLKETGLSAGAIHGENHVNATCFHSGCAATELRPSKPDDEQSEREQGERQLPATGAAARFACDMARDVCARVFHRSNFTTSSAQDRDKRQERQQPEKSWVKKTNHKVGE